MEIVVYFQQQKNTQYLIKEIKLITMINIIWDY